MKLVGILFCGLLLSPNAYAWKFYWTPTGVIFESVIGKNGINCVAKGTQPGDIVTYESQIMIVKSVAEITPKCIKSSLPVEASLEMNASSSGLEKVLPNITIPDGYKRNQMSEEERIKENLLVSTIDINKDSGLNLFVVSKSVVKTDSTQYALQALKVIEGFLENSSSTTPISTSINGAKVWRNQVKGVHKTGDYKLPLTYLQTVYEGDAQFYVLRQFTNEKNFPLLKVEYENTAKSLKNIVTEKKLLKEPVNNLPQSSLTLIPTANEIYKNLPQSKSKASTDAASKLENLKQLLDKGLITQKDYDSKKAEVLKSM